MDEYEKAWINEMIQGGYHVEVVDPYGASAAEKYRVYQNYGWNQLKTVVVNGRGRPVGLQG